MECLSTVPILVGASEGASPLSAIWSGPRSRAIVWRDRTPRPHPLVGHRCSPYRPVTWNAAGSVPVQAAPRRPSRFAELCPETPVFVHHLDDTSAGNRSLDSLPTANDQNGASTSPLWGSDDLRLAQRRQAP